MSFTISIRLVSDTAALIKLSQGEQCIHVKLGNFSENRERLNALLDSPPQNIEADVSYVVARKHDDKSLNDMARSLCHAIYKEYVELSSTVAISLLEKPVAFSYRYLDDFREYWNGFTPYELFRALSEDLLELPYTDEPDDCLYHKGNIAFHTNHGTTHAIRQYILVNKLLYQFSATPDSLIQEVVANLTGEERACIELGAFLFRSGRTNEKGWSEDGTYGKRSAEIFQHVATKLDFNPVTIALVAASYDYHSDLELPPLLDEYDREEAQSKALLFRSLLKLSHESDLVRCQVDESSLREMIQNSLVSILPQESFREQAVTSFLSYAAHLCELTGAPIAAARFSSTGSSVFENRIRAVMRAHDVIGTCNQLAAVYPSIRPSWQSPTEMWLDSPEHVDRGGGKLSILAHDKYGAVIPVTDPWTEEQLSTLPIDKCVMHEKERLEECVTVYHSTTLASRAFEILCEALAPDDEKDIIWLRVSQQFGASLTVPTVSEIKKKSQSSVDNGEYMSWTLISANPTLLHNADYDSQESSTDYFFNGSSVKQLDFQELFIKLLDKRGLLIEQEALRKALYKQFEALIKSKEYGTHGVLYQFHIPHHLVNQVAYISGENGILDTENPNALDTLVAMKTPGLTVPKEPTRQVRLLIPKIMQLDCSREITVNRHTAIPVALEQQFQEAILAIAKQAIEGPTVKKSIDDLDATDEADRKAQSYWSDTGSWAKCSVTFYNPAPCDDIATSDPPKTKDAPDSPDDVDGSRYCASFYRPAEPSPAQTNLPDDCLLFDGGDFELGDFEDDAPDGPSSNSQ